MPTSLSRYLSPTTSLSIAETNDVMYCKQRMNYRILTISHVHFQSYVRERLGVAFCFGHSKRFVKRLLLADDLIGVVERKARLFR